MMETVSCILLYFGVGVCLLSAAGIVAMRGMYDMLHYLAPMSTLGAWAVAAAMLFRGHPVLQSLKVVLLAVLLTFSSAVLTEATARAYEFREKRMARQKGEKT